MKTFARQNTPDRKASTPAPGGPDAGLDHASVISSLLEAVVVVSARRGIRVANPAALELLELDARHLALGGGLAGVLSFTDAEGSPLTPGSYPDRMVVRTGRPVSGMIVGYILPSGRRLHLKCNAVLVDGSDDDDPTIAVSIRDITEKQASWRRLAYAAHHDLMTGLLNRTAALTRLQAALTERPHDDGPPRSLAVMFIDLDHMKRVNDTLGHADGDRALIAVARRLHSLTPPPGFVGRLGGDEFIAVIDSDARDEVEWISRTIHQSLAEPVDIRGQGFVISASVGLVRVPGDDDRSAADLIRDADEAMYAAKMAGGGRTVDFDSIGRDGLRSIGA
ncbi:diguanylate cyclase domain-containing protein [Gordonia rubripertincta]|uniref:Diguanylate cyclase n=1 Tax=Gordonia rubripertincta TaxID=36822 RepID=A0ABT4N1G1_GORRU|nr:diguanylate cyclase [Gordonia rubripertincta]MCZ4551782.1 diguanylate cyclase [Gordonia rubripertincta]